MGRRNVRDRRRTQRIVRRVELWSVLKMALALNAVGLAVVLATVVILWSLATTTGSVDDVEAFLRDAGFDRFRIEGRRTFDLMVMVGIVAALGSTVLMVVAAMVVNLIAEVSGGIRFIVMDDAPAQDRPSASVSSEGSEPIQGREGA